MTARLLFLVHAMGVGCAKAPAAADGDRSSRAEGRYALGDPGEGWKPQRPGGADKAWFHADHAAAIYADSNCGRRYEDSSLSDLLTHLTYGISRGDALSEETLQLDGRAALMRVHAGSLDGVAIKVGALVTKKHRCNYDMLFIAPPSTFDVGWPGFVEVVRGFSVGER